MNSEFQKIFRPRKEIIVDYDPKTEALWLYFNPKERFCYTLTLLQEIHSVQLEVVSYFQSNNMDPKIPIKFFVSASKIKGVYNYGGDLNLFSELILNKDKYHLKLYAKTCIDCVYFHAINLELPITTISLVEGTALGGGLEAALAGNLLIAEKDAKMGFPEIRFNLFPGMGAYSLLARLVGIKTTEELISSGKIYDAKALYDMGIVSIISEHGKAKEHADDYMLETKKVHNGMQAIKNARHRFQPIDYSELIDIVDIWVDAALRLEPKDIRMMKKLVKMQNGKSRQMNTKPIAQPCKSSNYLMQI